MSTSSGPPGRESRPSREAKGGNSLDITGDEIVTRDEVAALLATLSAEERTPRWYTHPANERQFVAAIIALRGWPIAVMDESGEVVLGLKLRRKAAAR